ncbi:nitrite reductase small subunit NirD [Glaciecola sp. MH2013]|uniref:nitrite reductase small subunit NirD n=1 Tax=Glaciecola sp. MH2013 TaxID=2785524 RepID=UPI00189D9430|nr:nitrite reductase small subunit NirD [Glaciecola sp. MH2013]MBF7073601.1 nitrite reductase small subunit NirD [Glaciecola sp. MH2013]
MTTASLPVEKINTNNSVAPLFTHIDVCSIDDLILNSGVCALVHDTQIAIFAIPSIANSKEEIRLFACSNFDPIGKANVMYRGLLCSSKNDEMEDEAMICSPLYKQHYSLVSGKCAEDENVSISIYKCYLENGRVFVSMPSTAPDLIDSTHKVTKS